MTITSMECGKDDDKLSQSEAENFEKRKEILISEARSMEAELRNRVNEINQTLGGAKKAASRPSPNVRNDGHLSSTMQKILESLDLILLKREYDESVEAPFVFCPQCNHKVDFKGCLKLKKKKKRAILFSCSFCDEDTRFSLSSLVENMIGANFPIESSAPDPISVEAM